MTPRTDPSPCPADEAADRRTPLVLLAAILLVAAIFRFHGIGGQSFWTDEVAGLLMADRPWPQVIGVAALLDVNPPLGYLAIHVWEKFGRSEAWMRTLPALLGVLAVLLAYRLGRALAGRRAGLIAALLLAASPFAVYSSHEVRYYNLGLVLALADLLVLARLARDPADRRTGPAFVVFWMLSWLTHYYFFFLFAGCAAWFLAATGNAAARRRFLKLSAVAGLLYAPWLVAIAAQFMQRSFRFRPRVGALEALYQVWAYFTLGHSDRLLPGLVAAIDRLPRDAAAFRAGFLALTAPFAVALAGNFVRARDRRRDGAGLPATVLVATLALVLAASRATPLFRHMYFILLLPAFLLLCARGIERLRGRIGVAAYLVLAAILGTQAVSLHAYQADPRYQREDWRGLVATLHDRLRPGDAVVAYSRNAAGGLYFYGEPGLPIVEALPDPSPAAGEPGSATARVRRAFGFRQASREEVDARLDAVRARHPRVWLVRHYASMFDPAGHVADFFARRMVLSEDLAGRFRIDAALYYRDREDALADRIADVASDLRFDRPYSPLQVGDGVQAGTAPSEWVWLGPRAEVWLPAPSGPATLVVEAMLPAAYLPPPARVSVAVEGNVPATATLTSGDPVTLTFDVPPNARNTRPSVRVTIETDRSFTPTPGEPPKSILVRRIALEPRL